MIKLLLAALLLGIPVLIHILPLLILRNYSEFKRDFLGEFTDGPILVMQTAAELVDNAQFITAKDEIVLLNIHPGAQEESTQQKAQRNRWIPEAIQDSAVWQAVHRSWTHIEDWILPEAHFIQSSPPKKSPGNIVQYHKEPTEFVALHLLNQKPKFHSAVFTTANEGDLCDVHHFSSLYKVADEVHIVVLDVCTAASTREEEQMTKSLGAEGMKRLLSDYFGFSETANGDSKSIETSAVMTQIEELATLVYQNSVKMAYQYIMAPILHFSLKENAYNLPEHVDSHSGKCRKELVRRLQADGWNVDISDNRPLRTLGIPGLSTVVTINATMPSSVVDQVANGVKPIAESLVQQILNFF